MLQHAIAHTVSLGYDYNVALTAILPKTSASGEVLAQIERFSTMSVFSTMREIVENEGKCTFSKISAEHNIPSIPEACGPLGITLSNKNDSDTQFGS